MLIDSDNENGDTNSLKDTIKYYEDLNEACGNRMTTIRFMRDNLRNVVWNPLKAEAKDNMAKIISKEFWSSDDVKDLYDFLYTKDEQDVELARGYYGRTSIGSYFMTDAIKGDEPKKLDEYWETFFNGISNEDAIFVVGSMFGGTGASAIPTIAKLLKGSTTTEKNKIGATIVMPYYKTTPPPVDSRSMAGIVNSSIFAAKNKAALGYYRDQGLDVKNFSNIYFVGEDPENFMNVKYENGGTNQKNKAHHTEIFAALTINDFINDFLSPGDNNSIKSYDMRVRFPVNNPNINLFNNPYVDVLNNLKGMRATTEMTSFLEMAILFHTAIIRDYFENTGGGTWRKKCSNIEPRNFEKLDAYCFNYMQWMYEVLVATNGDGQYMNPVAAFMNGDVDKSPFRIVNLGRPQLWFFTGNRCMIHKGFFSSFGKVDMQELEGLRNFSNDPGIENKSGIGIVQAFNDTIGKRSSVDSIYDLMEYLQAQFKK
jgi:hypothetical protein